MTEITQIYNAYCSDVYRYLLHLCRDESIAEDLTSETFFKAMRGIHTFRGDCEMRVWLCQIAKNSYYTYVKKQERKKKLDKTLETTAALCGETVDERIIRQAEARQIREILHDVPEPYKEVFMWRVFAEMSFKEIGNIFGKSENWACVTYHRAKAKIQERMEAWNGK